MREPYEHIQKYRQESANKKYTQAEIEANPS